jgi:hypothetical protein
VIGADPAAGLALLQLDGGAGRQFSTVTVRNSATLVKSSEASRESSHHVPGHVYTPRPTPPAGLTPRDPAACLAGGQLAFRYGR